MTINYLAIILLTIVSFIGGSIWFSSMMFGRTWMKIHGNDWQTPEEKEMVMKNGRVYMVIEFILTLVMFYILYLISIASVSLGSALMTTFLLWLGFVLPSITSTVIWGNDLRRWMFAKIALSSIYRLIFMLLAAWIFFIW